jgi:hypothetical protein
MREDAPLDDGRQYGCDVAIAVTGGTAVRTALIAAVTAHRRLVRQLAHDRLMRELDDARARLDNAAICLTEFGDRIRRVLEEWANHGREYFDESGWDAYGRLDELTDRMASEGERLAIRFGEAHPVTQSHYIPVRTALALQDFIRKEGGLNPDSAGWSRDERGRYGEELSRGFNGDRRQFVEAATASVGLASLPPETSEDSADDRALVITLRIAKRQRR